MKPIKVAATAAVVAMLSGCGGMLKEPAMAAAASQKASAARVLQTDVASAEATPAPASEEDAGGAPSVDSADAGDSQRWQVSVEVRNTCSHDVLVCKSDSNGGYLEPLGELSGNGSSSWLLWPGELVWLADGSCSTSKELSSIAAQTQPNAQRFEVVGSCTGFRTAP